MDNIEVDLHNVDSHELDSVNGNCTKMSGNNDLDLGKTLDNINIPLLPTCKLYILKIILL